MLVLLLGCWSPDPGVAPPSLAPLDPVPGADTDVEAVEPEVPEADTDTDGDPGDAADDAEARPPFVAYDGTTTAAPVTVVDDLGKPITVLQRGGVPLKVVDEDPIRKRVICEVCAPVAEGWVQTSVVTGRP